MRENDKNNILFHVGIGKSGTTSIQNKIFNNLNNVSNLGRPNPSKKYLDFQKGLIHYGEFNIDNLVKPFLEEVSNELEKVSTVIVSDETLRSHPHELVARRISRYFPDAKILITIRNQYNAIVSHYVSHGRRLKISGWTKKNIYVSFNEYFDFHNHFSDEGIFSFFNYYNVAKTYSNIFSQEKVKIIMFEDMVNQNRIFYEQLRCFLGNEFSLNYLRNLDKKGTIENKGKSARFQTFMNIRNQLPSNISFKKLLCISDSNYSKIVKLLRGGKTNKIILTQNQKDIILKHFGKSNFLLEKEYKLNLSNYGYPMDS